ncbi:hypothetical protein GCM10022246_29560 [Pedobacter ginsengiterrae]|uniref:HTH araC/xylS-type domain-containing protein n=1 Tax=Pedobacter ginsengiterrae TaxID=871696 RepID=A0ABP7Q399_9SPHI|nr:AraC family transcriptional regulator [Pedobacter aquatilis]
MDKDLNFKLTRPDKSVSDFVESFWLLHNQSDQDKDIVVLPDGRLELTFSKSEAEPFHIVRSGIETFPSKVVLKAKTLMFAISFKLLATEYIFQNVVSNLLNYAEYMPLNFWDFTEKDLENFDGFCEKASKKIHSLLPKNIDERKQKLFDLIYASKGSLTVKELSQSVYWNSRQINRYFNQQYGISLKLYCNILRFRGSLDHIAQGQLFPESHFTDQSHFIREIKKFSGVVPKELLKNKNDRFIQFSVLDRE